MKDTNQIFEVLLEIDRAVNSSFDLRLTLDVALAKIISTFEMDAAGVLLLKPDTMTLEYAAAKGFRTQLYKLAVGEGFAGRAALEKRLLQSTDIQAEADFELREEGFTMGFAVPLVAKGEIVGVLEVFRRSPAAVTPQWLNFLEAAAGRLATAVDNARLFESLQHSAVKLNASYEAVIEGWMRALDMRSKETEGQARRVTELTMALAKAIGFPEERMVDLRRGALLHGVGKLGIPDAILFKPTPLTEAEMKVMCTEPMLAYQVLSNISFLSSAAEIVYCCHENWDGTGYPRGLTGNQIPLGARIVAVALAWDEISSAHPNRPPMMPDKAIEYMREQSNKTLDPKLVSAFLKMMGR